ncbi:hypothetical protein [Amaricoccus sp. W119]|uniref:hypothetical protein n=1 Tax=Amaricoccus sp. W119 TaxID=3391833 RepID=UPI0039A682A6
MNALPDFTFDLAGEGVAFDPGTGLLTIATEALVKGIGVVMTARDASGTPTGAFRITVRLTDDGTGTEPEPEVPVAPEVVTAPALSGPGLVGVAMALDTGRWSGTPEPGIAIEWLRDGVAIEGATGTSYLPVALDDETRLGARVTARNAAGEASAETAPVAIARVAPSATGTLADLVLVRGEGMIRVETGAVFAGEALGFSVTGGDGVIDPATGALELPLGTPRSQEEVTVSARNSGGTARAGFRLTILAMAPPEPAGIIGDLVAPLGAGARSVSTQAGFTGEDLSYTLETAPPGVTILPGSGLVTVPTALALDGLVTVRAANAGGEARQSFRVTVGATTTPPIETETIPAAALDGEWSLDQVTEQAPHA